MQISNITEQKRLLRSKYKAVRISNIDNKYASDIDVFNNIVSSGLLSDINRVLIYVSTEIEVDTRNFILWLFENNIEVAVPKCDPISCEMKFFIIDSFDDLESGSYKILEPDINKCVLAENSDKAICIVPGLSFDKNGFRLGFGKGYYDRFLADVKTEKMCLCFGELLSPEIPTDEHDIKMDYIVTEKGSVKI